MILNIIGEIITKWGEWGGVSLAISGIWLTTQRRLSGWPVSLCACLVYAQIFYQAQLYADMILQGFFCLGILYGWICWWRDTVRQRQSLSKASANTSETRPLPCHITQGDLWVPLTLTLFFGLFWAFILKTRTSDPAPYLDAMLSSLSLLAQYWTARRYRISWLLWAGTDSCYTLLFFSRALYPTTALYAGFIALALYGYMAWGRVCPISRPAPNKPG